MKTGQLTSTQRATRARVAVSAAPLRADTRARVEPHVPAASPNRSAHVVMASPVGAVLLLGLCCVGYFKGTAPFQLLPVDATLVFAVAVCAGVFAHAVARRWTEGPVLAAVVGLWMIFGLGAASVIGSGRGYDKVALLATVTLLCATAPCFFLCEQRAQRWWLGGVVVLSAVMAAAVLVAPDLGVQEQFGRLQLEGGVTIGSSRVIGAGIVIAIVFGLAAKSRRLLWWSGAAAGTGILVAIGSRGPFLALIVAVLLVLLLGRVFRGVRTPSFVTIAMGLVFLAWGITASGSRAAARILRVVTGEELDVSREYLLEQAWAGALAHPLGVGWGGFGSLGAVDRTYGDPAIYPHNIVLEITVESGWIAGAAFVVIAGVSLLGYVRASTSPEAAALLGLGVYWLLVAQTSSDVNGNRMTWASITLGLVLYANDRRARLGRHRGRAPAGSTMYPRWLPQAADLQ